MSQETPVCENIHKSTKVHLMVDGKYVKARISKKPNQPEQVELILHDEQGNPDSVECFTCVQETKKYVAFQFRYGSKRYLPKIEGETVKLVSDHVACPSVLSWLEMENIQAGESHYLSTTAGQIGVQHVSDKKFEFCIGGVFPVIFTQIPSS